MSKMISTRPKGPIAGKKPGFRIRNKAARPREETVEVELPTEADELSNNLADYSILIHGEKKVGKTSLLAQEPKALFLEFDPPQKALRILQVHCPDWRTFMACLTQLEEQAAGGEINYGTIVVDGADLMYQRCFDWACKKMGIVHPNDENDFGKSWRFIKNTFEDAVMRLMSLPAPPRFICHSTWKEQQRRDKTKFDKLVPNLTGQAEEVLVGLIDIWGAYIYDGGERVLVIQGDESVGAGNRVDHCFRTPKGEPVAEIGMGQSPKEAYANLQAAFANKQPYRTLAERSEAAGKGGTPKKKAFVSHKKR